MNAANAEYAHAVARASMCPLPPPRARFADPRGVVRRAEDLHRQVSDVLRDMLSAADFDLAADVSG